MDDYKTDKRTIIYQNNEFVTNYVEILSILDKYECKYTKNSNGIFINLTTLSDTIIDKIYPFFLNNTLEKYQDIEFQSEMIQTNETNQHQTNYPKRESSKQTYIIPIDEFSPQEKKIIRMSNNYFL
jgi:hypothetical protein